ncbi:MAG: hypothetical protein WB760_26445 [Xanthobacteraceae bacterium]
MVIIMGDGYTSQAIDGFSSKETCEQAAAIARHPKSGDLGGGIWDAAVCLPKN